MSNQCLPSLKLCVQTSFIPRNEGNMSERVTWLSADCCFSELALWKSNQACQSRTKGASSSYQCKVSLFSPWYSWIIVELALSNNHLLTLSIIVFTTIIWFELVFSVCLICPRLNSTLKQISRIWNLSALHCYQCQFIGY